MNSILMILILATNGDQMARPVIDHVEFTSKRLCEIAATEFKRTVEQDYQNVDPKILVTTACVRKI